MSRLFAVVAALLLVFAFGLIVLTPTGMTLDQGVATLGPTAIADLRHFVHAWFGTGAWSKVAIPLLVRPVWLIPACLGIIAVGASASTGVPPESARRTRTRS